MNEGQGNTQWMVDVGGQQYGPFQGVRLAKWVQGGKIVPQALIHKGGQQFTPEKFLAEFKSPPPVSSGDQWAVAPGYVDLDASAINPPPGISQPVSPAVESSAELPILLEPIEAPPRPPAPKPLPPPMEDWNIQALASAARDAGTEDVVERDQIVVIGRRRSGKTIFLASIYGKLWKSLNEMTAKALTGEIHKELIEINRMLKQGQWPSSTVGARQMAMELEYNRRKRLLVAMDYAGEKFSDAFVKENTEDPLVKKLLKHIDHAAAVMLLIDPSVIAGNDIDAVVDDDFGMVQAVQRIRNWPGGQNVPIVLVLTKMDLHQGLIDRSGGVKEFVRQHFPALVRVLKEIPIFQISAVQVEKAPDGSIRPRADSALINIENPLRFCLSKINIAEQAVQRQQSQEDQQRQELQMEMEEQQLEARHKRFYTIVIMAMLAVGLGVIALIVIFRIG